MRILFFGNKKSIYTQEAISELKSYTNDITLVFSRKRFEKIPDELSTWSGDYIFSFESYYILPKSLINRANIAINIHPASPDFPGSGCASWAIYNNSKEFGVTAHLINENIDNGKIIKVIRFPIKREEDHGSLANRTKLYSLNLFKELINELLSEKTKIEDLIHKSKLESWNGQAKTIIDIDKYSIIKPTIKKEELLRRIKSFHTEEHPLKLELYGETFIYK